MSKSFLLPPEAQTGSLMRLPAEIRLNILRQLLTCEQPLEATNPREACLSSARHKKKQLKVNFSLYPSILATCQLLLSEASPVLYGENTITIEHMPRSMTRQHYIHGDDKRQIFCALRGLVALPRPDKMERLGQVHLATYRPTHMYEEPLDLEENALSSMHGDRAQLWSDRDTGARKLLALAAVLPRFQKFQLKPFREEDPEWLIDIYRTKRLYHLCRTLRPFLLDKDVTIDVTHINHDEGTVLTPEYLLSKFDYLRWLKCRSVEWKGVCAVDVEHISNCITRKEDTPDTCALWFDLIDDPEDFLSHTLGDHLQEKYTGYRTTYDPQYSSKYEDFSTYAWWLYLDGNTLDYFHSRSYDYCQDDCEDFKMCRHAALTNNYADFQRLKGRVFTRAQK